MTSDFGTCGQVKSGRSTSGRTGISSLVFAPNGQTVAASVGDYAINLWDVRTHQSLRHLQWDKKESPDAFWAEGLAFSPDGKYIASADIKSPIIHLWDTASGKQVRKSTLAILKPKKITVPTPMPSPSHSIASCWQPPAEQDLEAAESQFGTRRRGRNSHLTKAMNDPIHRDEPSHTPGTSMFESKWISPKLVFSPNGRMMVKNGRPKTIAVWETATGRQRLLLKGHEESTVCVAFAAGWPYSRLGRLG